MQTSASSRRSRRALVAIPLLMVASACSGDAAATGAELIEGEIADQIGLGALDATCQQPDKAKEGETFTCTATTGTGEVIEFTSIFEADDAIFVYPTNLVSDTSVFEAEAAQTLGPELDVVIDPSQVECPDGAVVLDAERRMECTITDTETGKRYVMIATLGDYVRDEGYDNRTYEVGDEIS